MKNHVLIWSVGDAKWKENLKKDANFMEQDRLWCKIKGKPRSASAYWRHVLSLWEEEKYLRVSDRHERVAKMIYRKARLPSPIENTNMDNYPVFQDTGGIESPSDSCINNSPAFQDPGRNEVTYNSLDLVNSMLLSYCKLKIKHSKFTSECR